MKDQRTRVKPIFLLAITAIGSLLIFNCIEDEEEGRYTLRITKPKGGMVTSDKGVINCGGDGSDCEADFNKGMDVILTAVTDNPGYKVGDWGGDCKDLRASEPCALKMNEDKDVTKAFNPPGKRTLSISKPKPTNGKVVSKPKGINCGIGGDDCTFSFDYATQIILTATPKLGYELGAWEGTCASEDTENTCTLIMIEDKTVRLKFSIIRYALDITQPTGGTVTSDKGGINCGDGNSDCSAYFDFDTDVTLTAAVKMRYTLGDWGKACESSSSRNTCTLKMNGNKDVTKAFNLPGKKTLTITQPEHGTITVTTSDGTTTKCGSSGNDCTLQLDENSSITLTAEADLNYEIGTWGNNCSSTPDASDCSLNMNADKVVSRMFPAIQYALTVTQPTKGTITSRPTGINCGESNSDCDANFDHGTSVTLTATPKTNYIAGAWGEACVSTTNAEDPCALTMDEAKNVTKAFTFRPTALECDTSNLQCGSCDIRDASDNLLMCQQCRLKSDGNVGLCLTGCGTEDTPLTANVMKAEPFNISAAVTSSFRQGERCAAEPDLFARCVNTGAKFTGIGTEVVRLDAYYYKYVKSKGSGGSQKGDAQADCVAEPSYTAIGISVTNIPGTYEDLQ